MINILSLLGACCVAAFQVNTSKALQPRQAINNAYYSVQDTLDTQDNVVYKQGNFYYDSATWGYDLPLLNPSSGDVCVLSGYTLFKDDEVVFNGFKPTFFANAFVTSNLVHSDLVTDLVQETNYYCGFFDFMFLWTDSDHSSNYIFSYWYRVTFLGNLSMNSDFSINGFDSLPQWDSASGNPRLSYTIPIDNFFLFNTGVRLLNYTYSHLYNASTLDMLGVVDSVFYDSTYPTTNLYTSGLALSYYPNASVMLCRHADYLITPSNNGFKDYSSVVYSSNSWSWLFGQNNRLPSVTFTCDYQRSSYAEATLYHQGYSDGYSQGANAGESAGYNNGYQDGYDTGYQDGVDLDTQTASIFSGILSVGLLPVNFFLSILNFEVFGINIGAFVSATLTIAIVIIIIRVITGKKND